MVRCGVEVKMLKPRHYRIAFLGIAAATTFGLYALSCPLSDFVEYWTAAHLFVKGDNPYSLIEMFRLQKALGWPEPLPLIPLNPPWILPLIAPLGFAKWYPLSWLLWVAGLALVLALSSRLLLALYSGEVGILGIAESSRDRALLGFSFYPTLMCLRLAQLAPLVLLGLIGFLWFERRNRPILAGIFLALTAIKPQVLYLVWLAILVWCFQKSRRWYVLISTTTVLGALLAVAVLVNHQVIREYWSLASGPYAQVYVSALGGIIRQRLGTGGVFSLQFLPPLMGTAWFAFYWRKHQGHWEWAERTPFLVTISVLTTAWGWLFDEVLLLVPIIALAAQYSKDFGGIPKKVLLIYTALNVVLIILVAGRVLSFAFLLPPILVGGFLFTYPNLGHKLTIEVPNVEI